MESTHTAHSLDYLAVIDAHRSRTVLAYVPASHHDARKLGNTGVTLAMASLPASFAACDTHLDSVCPDPRTEPTIIRTRRQVIAHLPLVAANGHKLALVLTLNAPFTLRRSVHGGSRTHPATVEYRDISLASITGLVRALAARLALLVDPHLLPHRDPPRDGEDKVTVVPHVQHLVEEYLVPCIPRGIDVDSFAVLGASPSIPLSHALIGDGLSISQGPGAVLKDALVFCTQSPFGLAVSNHASLTAKSSPHLMWMVAMFARLQIVADMYSSRKTPPDSTNTRSRSRSRSPAPSNASISRSSSSFSPSPPTSTAPISEQAPPPASRVDSSSRSIRSINSTTSGIISGHVTSSSTGPPSMGLFAWFGNLGRRASAALSHPASSVSGYAAHNSSTNGVSAPTSTSNANTLSIPLPAPTDFTLFIPQPSGGDAPHMSITSTWIPSHTCAALVLGVMDDHSNAPPVPTDPSAVRTQLDQLFPHPSIHTNTRPAADSSSTPDSPVSSRTATSSATTATPLMQTAPPGTLVAPFTSGTHLPHLAVRSAASANATPAGPIIDRIVSVVDSASDASDCQVTVGYALASVGSSSSTAGGGDGRVTASAAGSAGAVRRVWVAKESALERGVVVVPGHYEQSGRGRDKESAGASGVKRDNVSLAAVVDVLLQQG